MKRLYPGLDDYDEERPMFEHATGGYVSYDDALAAVAAERWAIVAFLRSVDWPTADPDKVANEIAAGHYPKKEGI